jgi:hypothetical protein
LSAPNRWCRAFVVGSCSEPILQFQQAPAARASTGSKATPAALGINGVRIPCHPLPSPGGNSSGQRWRIALEASADDRVGNTVSVAARLITGILCYDATEQADHNVEASANASRCGAEGCAGTIASRFLPRILQPAARMEVLITQPHYLQQGLRFVERAQPCFGKFTTGIG